MKRLENRVALITGGTRGIGLACARKMAFEGATVIICARDESQGRAAEQAIRTEGGDAYFIQLDISSEQDWQQVIRTIEQRFGGLHILVNSAASFLAGSFMDSSLAAFDKIFELNVRSLVIGLQAAVPLIKRSVSVQAQGAIINVSSAASIQPGTGQSFYAASKAAVDILTRSLAAELAREGCNIRVNAVNPGMVETDMLEEAFAEMIERGAASNAEELRDMCLQRHPVGRFAAPDEIANMITFLASPEASYITGAIHSVDGGYTA